MSEQDGGVAARAMPGLDALLRASLQDCPDAVLVRDDAQALTGRAFASLVQAAAGQFRQCGLQAGERVLLAMDFGVASLTALFAALRAGLEPALTSCGLPPAEWAAQAKGAAAAALVGPTSFGGEDLGEAYLSAAALSDGIRLVATLGPGCVDGAADFSPAALLAIAPRDAARFDSEAATILTFEAGSAIPVAHGQGPLFAAALALVDQAGIEPSKPLLSTIVPATLAGLVGGPFAALIGASSLTLHGPFAAAAFLRACDAQPGAHLVAPAAIGPLLEQAAMTADGGSLILLSRLTSPAAFEAAPALGGNRRVVDFYALRETAVVARHRSGLTAIAPPEFFDGSVPGPLGPALNRARSAAAGG